MVVQLVENHEELGKYIGKSLIQIVDEENCQPLEFMYDLAVATDLRAEFLRPNKDFKYGACEPGEMVVVKPAGISPWFEA